MACTQHADPETVTDFFARNYRYLSVGTATPHDIWWGRPHIMNLQFKNNILRKHMYIIYYIFV